MTDRLNYSKTPHWFGRSLALAALALAATAPVGAVLPPGNAVQQWNRIAEDTVVSSGAFQNESLIYMAYESAAVYDAVVAIEGRFEPYGVRIAGNASASVDAAVIEAAYRTLRNYFPAQAATLDSEYAEALAAVPDGPSKDAGKAIGSASADAIIALRASDGRRTPIGVTSTFPKKPEGPGVWRLTPPAFAAPQTPWVGEMQPFVLNAPGQFHPHPPPPLSSQRWVAQFNEVQALGAVDSSSRTPQQTDVARFWTANVIRQYNRVGREIATNRLLGMADTARLLAMINIVGADAQIEVMHWKYTFLFWRPVTAIDPSAVTNDGFGSQGYDDQNPLTTEMPGWRPLLGTPNHPEYPGAHGSITSAVAEVLTEFLGTGELDVDIHGFSAAGLPGNLDAVRHFDTAEQLRAEIVEARLWGGLHYRGSTEAGVQLGARVAHYDLNHAFRARR